MHQLNWQPGSQGKGLIVNGDVHTWNTDEYGEPHHAEAIGQNVDDDTINVQRNHQAFYITPRGDVTFSLISGGEDDPRLIEQADPRLKPDYSYHKNWDFQASKKLKNEMAKNPRQGNSAFATELKLWLDGFDPKKAQGSSITPHHESPWDFVSANLPYPTNTENAKWKPGTYGKGFIDYRNNAVHSWTADGQDGDPSHREVLMATGLPLGDDEGDKAYHAFWIEPQGRVDHVKPVGNGAEQKMIQQAHPETYMDESDWDFTGAAGDTAKPKPKPVRKRPEGLSDNEWEQMKLDWAQSDDGEGRPYPFPPQPEHWRHDHAPDVRYAVYEFSINNTRQDLGTPPNHEVEDWEPGHDGKVLFEKDTGNIHVVKSAMPNGDEYSHVELAHGRGIPDDAQMWAGWVDPAGKYFGNLIPRKHMNSVFDKIEQLGGQRSNKVNEWGDWHFGGAPQKPPHYREADKSTETCGNCKMYHHGKCWGYANIPVRKDHVCDSWAKDK